MGTSFECRVLVLTKGAVLRSSLCGCRQTLYCKDTLLFNRCFKTAGSGSRLLPAAPLDLDNHTLQRSSLTQRHGRGGSDLAAMSQRGWITWPIIPLSGMNLPWCESSKLLELFLCHRLWCESVSWFSRGTFKLCKSTQSAIPFPCLPGLAENLSAENWIGMRCSVALPCSRQVTKERELLWANDILEICLK